MNIFKSFLIIILIIFLISCKKDSSNPASGTIDSNADINGLWVVTETENGNCSSSSYPKITTAIYNITVNGNVITITRNDSQESNIGTINGLVFSFTKDEDDEDGTTHITFNGSVTADGKTMSGTAQWTYNSNNQINSCSGTTQLNGTRMEDAEVAINGQWTGTWASTDTQGMTGNFQVWFIQNNNDLTGKISVPYAMLENADLKGIVSGKSISFGDIEEVITFSGLISDDSSSASGTYNYSGYDSGTWQCTKGSIVVNPENMIVVTDSFQTPDIYGDDITSDGENLYILSGEKILKYSTAGNKLDEFDTPGNYPRGLAYDGNNLIVADNGWGLGKVFKIKPDGSSVICTNDNISLSGIASSDDNIWGLSTGGSVDNDYKVFRFNSDIEVIDSFGCSGIFASGIAANSQYLWVKTLIENNGFILKFDHFGTIVDSIKIEFNFSGGIAFDGSNLWYISSSENKINKIADDGSIIDFIDCPDGNLQDITWDGSNFWLLMMGTMDFNQKLVKLGSDGSILQTLIPPGNNSNGLAFDGQNLLISDEVTHRIYLVNPGNINYFSFEGDFDKLSFGNSTYWALMAGSSDILHFDEEELAEGLLFEDLTYGVGIEFENSHIFALNSLVLNENKLYEFELDGTLLKEYDGGIDFPVASGLTFDGINFWCTGHRFNQNTQYVYKLSTISKN